MTPRAAVAATLVIVAAVHMSAKQQCACEPTRQFPAGVIDTVANTAYIADAQAGISAVALDSGAVIWRSAAATIPIGFASGNVVALRRASDPRDAQAVLLDRRTGSVSMSSQPFRFGRDPIGDRVVGGMLFSTSEDPTTLSVHWRDLAAPRGGTERDSGRALPSGAFAIAKDGAVRLVRQQDQPRDLGAASSTAYQRGSEFTSGSWGSGPCTRTLSLEPHGDRMTLSLECGPHGAIGNRRVLLLDAPAIGASVSVDGCSIFVEAATSDGARWTVFSSETGERLGAIAREPGAWHQAAAAGIAYYLTDVAAGGRVNTSLHAVDLKSGTKRWQRPVRSRTGKP